MATPHLTRSYHGTKYKLNSLNASGDKRLLIIRHTSQWTNQVLVSRPVEQKFAAAAAWGESSYYNSIVANYMAQDAATILANLNSRLSQCSWTSGSKNLFAYYARAGCPGRVRWQPSTVTTNILTRYLEFGADRLALKFDLRFLPLGNFETATPYLRLFNTSFIQTTAENQALAFNYSHNGTSHVLFKFYDSEPPVNGLGSGYGELDTQPDANNGEGTASGKAVSDMAYDVWDLATHAAQYSTGRSEVDVYGYQQQVLHNNPTPFDYEITGAMKTSLFRLAGEKRHVWMLIGYKLANGISGSGTYGIAVGSRVLAFAQAPQLVFKITGAKFNA